MKPKNELNSTKHLVIKKPMNTKKFAKFEEILREKLSMMILIKLKLATANLPLTTQPLKQFFKSISMKPITNKS